MAVVLMGVQPTGTITLDNVPAYHAAADFHWTLTKKPRYATLGVFCSQGGWVYIAELGVSQALTGSASVVIENEMSSAMPGRIDYSRPSDCQAFLFDERLVRQDKPAAITAQVFFTINP